ncbi:MAG: T9SS type A sorting domain-containing protein, partial [Ignavibacteria bacterium]|nr:T9SS type A sorting domain-containing protein [Ignavibacteria bacterium]
DRSAANAPCSIASVGFGLSAICIGVDHGWVSRQAAANRVLTTLQTFWTGPQGTDASGTIGSFGLFYHFLDMNDATRTWNSELSTIDTGLLLAGIIDAREYFDGADPAETSIRSLADSIYRRMNWNLMRNFNPGLMLGWKPGTGFAGYGQWIGYNEASIMYILAMGSPTYPVDFNGWLTWTQGYKWESHYGETYVVFPPLFGHQYSHCWIDYRNINDAYMQNRGITYFENSRRATLAQRAYSIANPANHAGYSDSLWGITASDTPTGYRARGAPPPQNDDGTITPTAPVSSIPFAPEVVIPVIHKMWNTYGPQLWTQYGFRDAFNLNVNWWDTDIIGIDQGPMIIMIENYRNQSVWTRFMQNADVQRGLQRAGFLPVTAVQSEDQLPDEFALTQNYPNPFNPATTVSFVVPARHSDRGNPPFVSLKVFDVLGREVATLVSESRAPGLHSVTWNASDEPSGVYFYRLSAGTFSVSRKMVLSK